MEEVAPGIWAWRTRHPEWNSTTERVASYALRFDDGIVIVDPLLDATAAREDHLDALRELAGQRPCLVYVTIPYHVRDSAEVADALSASVAGHTALQKRLPATTPFLDVSGDGAQLPFGVRAIRIGKPRRYEMPLLSPRHRALVFGDAVVGVEGGLRVWAIPTGESGQTWYRQRFLPTLRPLLDEHIEHVLVTHGQPVLGGGTAALADMIEAEPVSFRSSMLTGDARAPTAT